MLDFRCSISASCKTFFLLPKRPDQLSGPPSLLFNGYRCYFQLVKRLGSEVVHSSLSISRLRKSGAILIRPPSYDHRVDREKICKLIPVRFVRSVTNDMCTSLRTNEVCRSQITRLNSVLQVQMCLFPLLVLLIAKLHALFKYMLRRNIYICVYIYMLAYI